MRRAKEMRRDTIGNKLEALAFAEGYVMIRQVPDGSGYEASPWVITEAQWDLMKGVD